jgi:DNA (cytosine-5)-methyltransferase 1
VVGENVPGILRLAADDVCSDLERLVYSVGIFNFEAAAVGAWHRRARVFFVAHSEGRRPEPRPGERGGNDEKDREGPEHQIAGSGESPGALSDAGCSRGAQSEARFAESVKNGRLLTLNDQIAHLFPTPRAADAEKGTRSPEGALKEISRGHGIDLPSHVQIFPTPTIRGNYNRKGASPGSGDGLEIFVSMYPTPTANDSKNNNPPSQKTENGRHSDQLNVIAGGSLNPDWVEWLMGLPVGWTDIG